MSVSAIIVDDEPLARMRLKRLLESQGVAVLAEGVNGQEAVELVFRRPADVLFIDINMPIKDGLCAAQEITEEMDHPPAIVFCTAYDEYAIDAFQTNASAYLLKPVQAADVRTAIKKASNINRLQMNQVSEQEQTLAVHYLGALQNMTIGSFAYFRSIDKHVYASLASGEEILIDRTLKQLEQLADDRFIRIHRNALINKGEASRLLRDELGRICVEIKSSGKQLVVSRRHLSEVKKCFNR